MRITITDSSLIRLMQLSSASLPVGAYAFSQGLEYAVETGWVKSLGDTEEWLISQLEESMTLTDLPILIRMLQCLAAQDMEKLQYWDRYLLACRETKELSLSDQATGEALTRLLAQLGLGDKLKRLDHPSFLCGFCVAAFQWRISDEASCLGYVWSWLENQVAAATKLVPLGQTQAQHLLSVIQERIPSCIEKAKLVGEDEIGSSLPALSIASALHETQYSRLFRS